MDAGFAAAFAGVFIIMMGFVLLLSLVPYILYSLGLYKLAKNKGMDTAWLAWIPIANYYILGSIAKDAPYLKKHIPRIDIILLVSTIVIMAITFVLSFIYMTNIFSMMDTIQYNSAGMPFMLPFTSIAFILLMLISMVFKAFYIFILYHVFKLYDPDNAVIYTIICALIGFEFIFIFIIRNKRPVIASYDSEPEPQIVLD